MDFTPLTQALELVEARPGAGQALLLYALLSTLSIPQGQHAYLLTKLKEMEPATRQIAYGLMELMAQGAITRSEWQEAVQKMDRAIRGRA